MKLSDVFYTIRSYFRPYNVVKIQHLPRTWCDRDHVMFHAMFQILVDFVELEHPFTNDYEMKKRFTNREAMRTAILKKRSPAYIEENYFSGNCSAGEKIARMSNAISRVMIDEEVFALYEWYKDKKYELPKEVWMSCDDTSLEADDANDKKIDEMLHRLLAIRKHLWT